MIRLLLLLLVAACSRDVAEDPPASPPPAAPAKTAKPPARKPLPKGFVVKGAPEVTEAFLPPDASWRHMVSELTLLRAEGKELLVSFDRSSFHATDREGRRRTWRLPKGLTLSGPPLHVLLRQDLGIEAGAGPELQVVGEKEVTVVTGRIDIDGNVQEFRLVAQGGIGFRSISTDGGAG